MNYPPTADTYIFLFFFIPNLALPSYLPALHPLLEFSYCLAVLRSLPVWQPAVGTEDGLMGISHQLYTCLPGDSATDFSLRVEAILPLELHPFDTHQTLATPLAHANSYHLLRQGVAPFLLAR